MSVASLVEPKALLGDTNQYIRNLFLLLYTGETQHQC
jgi:hypothetical protein